METNKTSRIGARELRANAERYHAGTISHEEFHAAQIAMWDAIESQGARSKSAILFALRAQVAR